jgi:hypothetical protein
LVDLYSNLITFLSSPFMFFPARTFSNPRHATGP